LSTARLLPIFDSLMKKRFSHIIRSTVISFLMTGLLAHLLVPFSSHAQKTAFSQWLNQNVASSGDESESELRDAILKLPEQISDFRLLVEQASNLIASNKEDFRLNRTLPENSSDQVTSWLVGQWNFFQQQQTGTDALLPETPAPAKKWITPSNLSKMLFAIGTADDNLLNSESHFLRSHFNPSYFIRPLVSGISINAP